MELLNSLWTTLLTPNQTLTSLVCIPLSFVEAYLLFKTFTLILNVSYEKKQALLYVVLCAIFRNSNTYDFYISNKYDSKLSINIFCKLYDF